MVAPSPTSTELVRNWYWTGLGGLVASRCQDLPDSLRTVIYGALHGLWRRRCSAALSKQAEGGRHRSEAGRHQSWHRRQPRYDPGADASQAAGRARVHWVAVTTAGAIFARASKGYSSLRAKTDLGQFLRRTSSMPRGLRSTPIPALEIQKCGGERLDICQTARR